jgi:hypothetical protein
MVHILTNQHTYQYRGTPSTSNVTCFLVTKALQNQRIEDAKDSGPHKKKWFLPSPSFLISLIYYKHMIYILESKLRCIKCNFMAGQKKCKLVHILNLGSWGKKKIKLSTKNSPDKENVCA